jgi:hypothetical protein
MVSFLWKDTMTNSHVSNGSVGISPLDCFRLAIAGLGLAVSAQQEVVCACGERQLVTTALTVKHGDKSAVLTHRNGRLVICRGQRTQPVRTKQGDKTLSYAQIAKSLFPSGAQGKEVMA